MDWGLFIVMFLILFPAGAVWIHLKMFP